MLLTTKEAAAYLRLATPTLERFRLMGNGPAFCKMGDKAVRYREADLDDWVASRLRTSTSDQGEA
jgi:excisionase family DNA binding protein